MKLAKGKKYCVHLLKCIDIMQGKRYKLAVIVTGDQYNSHD
jgi:hypothetical protein